jgi:hypothetical protein
MWSTRAPSSSPTSSPPSPSQRSPPCAAALILLRSALRTYTVCGLLGPLPPLLPPLLPPHHSNHHLCCRSHTLQVCIKNIYMIYSGPTFLLSSLPITTLTTCAAALIPGFRIRIDLMRIRIRIQHFFKLRIRIPDPDPGFDDLKLKKLDFYFFDQKLQFRPKIRPFFYFFGSFLPSWIRIQIRNLYADPDPAAQINADPCGSGSGYGSGSETLSNTIQVCIKKHVDCLLWPHLPTLPLPLLPPHHSAHHLCCRSYTLQVCM